VQDAAVIGILEETRGELPRAFVVKKEDNEANKLTETDIQASVARMYGLLQLQKSLFLRKSCSV